MRLKPHHVVLVLGIRGSGKSYWIKKHIVKTGKRVVVWDPHGEYETRERHTLDELLERPSVLDREAVSLSVVPQWKTLTELAEEFEAFVELMASTEDLTIVIEEAGLLRRAHEHLEALACQSRHWGAPLVICAQRAVQVPKTAREQLSHLVSFRQSSVSDVDALVERCGEEATKVRRLPRRESWQWCEEDSFDNGDEEQQGEQQCQESKPSS